MTERVHVWVAAFWGAALLDGATTWWAVQPLGGTLDNEVNPFLHGRSWTYFFVFLAVLHLVIQVWFSLVWPRRDLVNDVLPDDVDLVSVTRIMFWRFLTVIIPDRIQVVYTGMTLYVAVLVAHLAAVVNNSFVALGRPGGFSALSALARWVAPSATSQQLHTASIVLFYAVALALGMTVAHVWLVWRRRGGGLGTTWVDALVHAIPERAYRVGGTLLFGGCVAHKVAVYHTYNNKVLWVLEAGIFAALALFYAVRVPARSTATGVGETLIPLLGGIWPFFLLFAPRTAFGLRHQGEILAVMCFGTGLALWAYVYLNRAFTIMVEARQLKQGGPYRFVRHPIYTGQIITAAAVTVWRYSPWNVVLTVLFATIQWWRARLEERKLTAAFSEYAEYRERTGMFLPWL